MMVIGNVKITKIGLTKTRSNPKTIATIIADVGLATETPGNK